MLLVKILLLPFSFLYGLITAFRNLLFNWGILHSKTFDTFSISVGNITVGGTGKSPHIEYLAQLLSSKKIAILSRGYKRITRGFLVASESSTYLDIGDEPMQFHSKFKDVTVAVDGDRRRGISNLEQQLQPDIILLDDCFQHRWVKPSLNIVLLDYSTIGESQFMLPSGELREWKKGINRADILVISKSPAIYSPIEHRRIKDLVQPSHHQKTFFSFINYKELTPFNATAKRLLETPGFSLEDHKAVIFAGIAKIDPMIDHLQKLMRDLIVTEFKDHHGFQVVDILNITNQFDNIISSKKILITTEKDAMRLNDKRLFPLLEQYPVFYLPIEIKFHQVNEEDPSFDETILSYVPKN